MELGNQIKKMRNELSLSQDELAEKIFVSRQSISNWENDKTYPDIKSLILLSEVFSVSLDTLVKGDIPEMKKKIDEQEFVEFQRDSKIYTALFIAVLLLPLPLARLLDWWAFAVYLPLLGAAMYYAFRLEKYKKTYDIQTYKEIVAFTEGKNLNELEKAMEKGKRPYQKVMLAILSALLAIIVSSIMAWIIKWLS